MVPPTMKQLYYTSCRTGKSVGGSSGFQVRATSSNVPPDRLRATIAYVGYSLPVTVMPSESTVKTAPVRLALLNTRDAGRLLCHSAYVGKDPMTGRFGNFFSHALLDVPPDVDASRAIQTWGSKFWRRTDGDTGTKLEELHELPSGVDLKKELTRFLSVEPNRQMLRFTLLALISGGENVRVFIAAPAEDVALCIYGVTKAFPLSMQGDLTFSTYETDPLTCNARLVGTWWGEAPEMDLPSSCYSGSYVGYNSYTSRKTELAGHSSYTDFAVRALAAGHDQKVDEFRSFCERLQVDEADLLEPIYCLGKKEGVEGLSNEECRRLLQHPPLAQWLVTHSAIAAPLFEKINSYAKEDSEYHQAIAPLVANVLAAHPGVLEQLRSLSEDARGRLSTWVLLHSFLDRPSFNTQDLRGVADGLMRQPKDAQQRTLSKVVKVATEELIARGARPSGNVQPDLENLLLHLGPSTQKGPAGLFKMIRRRYSEGGAEQWKKPSTFLPALFAVALGGSRSDYLSFSQFGNRLESEVLDLINEIRRRGGRKALWMVEYQSRVWDSFKARSRWEDLTSKLINRRPWRRLLRYTLILFVATTCFLAVEEWKFNRFGLRDRISQLFRSEEAGKQKDKEQLQAPAGGTKGN